MEFNKKINLMEFRSTYKWGGGPDKTVLQSARLHDKERFNVTVVYLRNRNDHAFVLGDKGRSMGVDVIEILEDHPFDLKALREVRRIITERKIDILHARDYKTNFLALFLKLFKFRKLKIVTTTHGWVSKGFKISIYYFFDKIITGLFDLTFVLYKNQLKEFILPPSPKRTAVIHNAIDEKEWDPAAVQTGKLRKELKLPEDIPLIGFIGRIMPEKDLMTLVHVAEELVHKRKLKVHFIIVGEGKDAAYENRVKTEIRRLELYPFIHILGIRNELKEVYRDLDIFLLTSVKEGFPNSLLEAMAMGVPGVVSAVGGIPEIVVNRKTGLLCRPRNVKEFTDGLEELIKKRNLREQLAKNARQLVETELSFDNRLRKVEDEYIQLMHASTRKASVPERENQSSNHQRSGAI